MTGLQFAAAIVNSLAWPAAVVAATILLRQELVDAFHRMQSFEFAGGKATFATLPGYEKAIAAVARDADSPVDEAIVRRDETEFSVLDTLAAAAPAQAIIYAWGLLEYQLNMASDRLNVTSGRVAPDQSHGWPQVARSLDVLDNWPLLYPAIEELRRLRDYTARSSRAPSSADAARYVSVVQELVTTLRSSVISKSDEGPGGAE